MDPLPPLKKKNYMVIQHERQNQLHIPTDESQSLINVVNSKRFGSKFNSAKKGARVCMFCGKTNHIMDNFFKKHGTPPYMQKQFPYVAHNATSDGSENGLFSNNTNMKDGFSPMTQDQFGVLMNLLQKSSLDQVAEHASSN